MLPNFLVIGPPKCGTTWIYHALKDHPEICVSTAKEPLFFNKEFYRGIEWYSKLFNHCNAQAKAIGEASASYIYSAEAAERIHSVNPGMKLISCLRNPIEKTHSHYLNFVRRGRGTATFRETLKDHPWLIEKGKYFKSLQPYFKLFNKNQLYIKLFDELKNDQTQFIQSIYKFLEVESEYVPSVEKRNQLSAAKPRNSLLASTARKCAIAVRKAGYPEVLTKIKYSGFMKILYKEYKKDEKPTIKDDDKEYLRDFFKNDVKRLSHKLGIDLQSTWNI